MMKNVLLALVFVDFLVLSGWAMWEVGYLGIFAVALKGPGEAQVFADLCIALTFGSRWLYRDARTRGWNPWPWLVSVPLLGSISLVGYWAAREWAQRGEANSLTAAPEA